ncbi:Lon protease C-terminal proteolytic domain-containing protein, partial [Lipomyces japonicus]|uniref:Lon protease C-terminal proteolytic domain-containing protein n=1 Tax=Lipomyces japonicus TaxID=56871 RepID=UPI0034CF234B
VAEDIPEVMVLPIVSRPLFPGFYKAVVLRDDTHIEAVKELNRRGHPFVGVFLNRESSPETEIVNSDDDVYHNGVLAQITSIFPQSDIKDVNQKEGLTIVLYPHRRIRINKINYPKDFPIIEKAEVMPVESDKNESDVTSFDVVTPDKQTDEFQDKPWLSLRGKVTTAEITNRPDDTVDKNDATVRAIVSEIVSLLKEISAMNPLFRDQITAFTLSLSTGNVFDEPTKLSDFAAAVSAGELDELQELIDTTNVPDRLQKGLVLLKKELMNAKLQSKITKDVENRIQKRQREYFLMEQMKGIKRELGLESDAKDKLIEKFTERKAKLNMPEAAERVFSEEINKFSTLETSSSEFNVTRNYLDWITQIPWGVTTADAFSLKNAKHVLNEDHYGLDDVKTRILEFIAVSKLRGNVDGKILCLVGPPGVGKTSIGKSIARSLNRQFERFSVGGLADVAEIKGHRRTYVGALPGKIIQSLKKTECENPLILIDEVDKLGRGHNGDPASALLELLDPEQNNNFVDHYLDIPVDLSKVLFVCTANVTDTIPRPLLDRMEVIEVSGYITDEKKAIASRYLAPQAREKSGLKDVEVNLTPEALDVLIKDYCRESGVRNLKKQIEKVYRKAALKIVEDVGEPEEVAAAAAVETVEVVQTDEAKPEEAKAQQEQPKEELKDEAAAATAETASTTITTIKPLVVPSSVHIDITAENLKDYVGPPTYNTDRIFEDSIPPGVVTGLAWTSVGGTVMYVESVLESALEKSKTGSFKQTGMLGDVMKESTTIAYTFARNFIALNYPKNTFFDHAKIHMHCPEGATPKDGPSAGVTISTSLLSLALNRPVEPLVAMTGEITVTGRVLRIGGLREKTVAARSNGAKTVFFPYANLADWEGLPDNIKQGLEGVPVRYYHELFARVFGLLTTEQGNRAWAAELEAAAASKKGRRTNSDDEGDDDILPPDFFPPSGGVGEIRV